MHHSVNVTTLLGSMQIPANVITYCAIATKFHNAKMHNRNFMFIIFVYKINRFRDVRIILSFLILFQKLKLLRDKC